MSACVRARVCDEIAKGPTKKGVKMMQDYIAAQQVLSSLAFSRCGKALACSLFTFTLSCVAKSRGLGTLMDDWIAQGDRE